MADAPPPGTRPPPQDLTDRCVVVTGASRGLGATLAERATQLGAVVAGCARTTPITGVAVAAVVDVADHRVVTQFAATVAERLGPIDLWINNAAVIDPIAPLRDQTPDDVAHLLGTNVVGVWNGTTAFVRHRRALGGGGVVINVSSGVALKASAGTGLYSASKAAVDRLTEATALEEADQGIAAWAIQPGILDTAMQGSLRAAEPEAFPRTAEFRELAERDAFNPGPYAADWLLAIAFDPAFRPPTVAWRIPDAHPGRRAAGHHSVDRAPAR